MFENLFYQYFYLLEWSEVRRFYYNRRVAKLKAFYADANKCGVDKNFSIGNIEIDNEIP